MTAVAEPAAAGVGLCLVVGLTAPAALRAIRRSREPAKPRGHDSVSGLYRDEDGEATEASTLGYSDTWPRVTAWLGAAAGVAAAAVEGVLANQQRGISSPATGRHAVLSLLCSWSDLVAWVFVFAQCACLPRRGRYQEKYRMALYGVASAAILAASLLARDRLPALAPGSRSRHELGLGICWLVELVAAVAVASSLALIPRRPDVYHRGGLVDQQHTVSLLSQLSFSWNRVVFAVSRERQLQMRDLPQLDAATRSSNLHARFVAASSEARAARGGRQQRLWWLLVRAHYARLLQQWSLVLLSSLLALFPQYVLYNFLERLEDRHGPPSAASGVWAWALALCLALALQVAVSGLLGWWTNNQLVLPVQGILQSLVFHKALSQHETATPGQKADDGKGDAGGAEGKEKEKDKTRQSVINHMKLDSGRVTMFCSFNFYFPMAAVKLVLAGGFLVRLLGWRAVAAGLLSAASVLPVSAWMSKRYGKIQFGLMKYRDGKAHLLTEALQGMRQIRYSALEQFWEDKIMKSRNEELGQFWKVSLMMCALTLVVNIGPLLLGCVALSVYAFEQGPNIRASVIFASLGLFDQLDEVTAFLPLLQVYLTEAWTSCVRLEKFLNQPDKAPVAVEGEAISFQEATVAWPKIEETEAEAAEEQEARSTLRNVSLEFPVGGLSIITGKTGSGKSLLLAAILGEVKLLSGVVRAPTPPPETVEQDDYIPDHEWIIPSLTAFVSQTPWIEAGTVRENITFGLPFDPARYQKTLRACSLEKDIELLVDGDQTEVGPKGVTLSGGQRWRVALARALYSRAGILVLDDVLSAVDAHVGRRIVEEALAGELARGRTRILSTHHAEMCLPRASYLVRLHDGEVESAEALADQSETDAAPESATGSTRDVSETNTTVDAHESQASDETIVQLEDNAAGGRKKDDEETRETGRVKWKVYSSYLKAGNAPFLWILAALLVVGASLAGLGRTWSLKELAEDHSNADEAGFHAFTRVHETQLYLHNPKSQITSGQQHSIAFWIVASVVFYLLSLGLSVLQNFTLIVIGLRASRKLFERMTHAVLRAPLRWVDTVPAGRILNRFTSDTFMVDRRLPSDLGGFLQTSFSLVVIIGASLSVSPYLIICGVLILLLYGRIALEYITAAREVKRLDSISHSPIYDQFSSVLSGLSTIRAFNRTNFYMNRMFDLVDNSAKATWALGLSGRWMNFRMGMLGIIFVTAVAVAVSVSSVDAALAGFGLTFALRYTSRLTAILQTMTSIELDFNAAERLVEYAEIETEPEGGKDAPAAWPTQGRIEVEDVTVAYKPDLPPVLKNVSFTVEPGERVGIVGRTGAGKSTLAAVFFRLLEPAEGSVRIDNIDISTLKLRDLRSRLAIIPQDPFLFSGTLRSNLDMEGLKDDYDLQTTLQRVHLVRPPASDSQRPPQYPPATASEVPIVSASEAVPPAADAGVGAVTAVDSLGSAAAPATSAPAPETQPGEDGGGGTGIFSDLSMEISTGGANLSQGQRQLVCLARALLARPKIVVLDEATSAVDRGTDAAIQESLRGEFAAAGCTVLVIAHRLSTVADFDKLLVLEEGRVAEAGTPAALMRAGMEREARRAAAAAAAAGGAEQSGDEAGDDTGAFWELVKKSAEREKLVEMVLGRQE